MISTRGMCSEHRRRRELKRERSRQENVSTRRFEAPSDVRFTAPIPRTAGLYDRSYCRWMRKVSAAKIFMRGREQKSGNMGESIAEELVQLLRGFSASLTLRLSHIIAFFVRYKNASSAGALAGFAIALICTWKYLKGPSRPQPKRFKKRDSPSSSNAASMETNAEGASTSVAKSITRSTNRGVIIRDSPSTSQLTLAQMVRRQLQGGRKMTLNLIGVVLEECNADEVQKHAVVRPAVVDVLLEISRTCDLYLLARVLDDRSEALVLAALDVIGIFRVGGLNRNKVLFCETEAGRTSFVRQLDPDWHVDTSAEIISQLARFIRHQLHIAPQGSASVATNVFGSESLEQYFGLAPAYS